MRELKFRVWSAKLYRFVSEQECNEPDVITIGMDGAVRGQYYSDHIQDYSVQQWTGLTDKNGKDIYEGDVLKDLDDELCEIVFDHGSFIVVSEKMVIPFWHVIIQGKEYTAGKTNEKTFEVIGNIFENPELCK